MPHTKSVKKSLRQSIRNQKRNRVLKFKFKESVKNFLAKPNNEKLKTVYSALDKMGKKSIFHKNKIARLKSKFARKVKPNKSTTTKKTTKTKKM